MDLERLKQMTGKEEEPNSNPLGQVKVTRYMLEVKEYPSGKVYTRSWVVDYQTRQMSKGTRRKKKALPKLKSSEAETI